MHDRPPGNNAQLTGDRDDLRHVPPGVGAHVQVPRLGKPDTARISLCSMASRRGLRRARDHRRRTTALCFRFRGSNTLGTDRGEDFPTFTPEHNNNNNNNNNSSNGTSSIFSPGGSAPSEAASPSSLDSEATMEVDNGDASSSDGGHSLDEQDDKLFPMEGEKEDEAPRAAR
ncbi:hypothetical protein EYF80_045026 [Liparis tanakae]|uniref:Uncharacterized protein n=1 Tax=Liparis tanakae TaxID=230148 RepID=A0A4Z2FU31_9TELE|nr:hypothetical protein EYF80_045026 [Liparis tanakae]